MAEVNKKIPDDILEMISGGESKCTECPEGAKECKNPEDWPQHEGHHEHCPSCKRKNVHPIDLYVPDWGVVIRGQECGSCGHYWIH